MEDAAETDAVFEEAVDLENGVVSLLRSTVGHIVYVHNYLRHDLTSFHLPNPNSQLPDSLFPAKSAYFSLSLYLYLSLSLKALSKSKIWFWFIFSRFLDFGRT